MSGNSIYRMCFTVYPHTCRCYFSIIVLYAAGDFLLGTVPQVVVGGILLYIMCSQLAEADHGYGNRRGFNFENGLVMGLP